MLRCAIMCPSACVYTIWPTKSTQMGFRLHCHYCRTRHLLQCCCMLYRQTGWLPHDEASVSAKAPHQRVTWSRQADAAATGPGRCCSTTTSPTASQNLLQPGSKRCVARWWLQVATVRHSHQLVWYVTFPVLSLFHVMNYVTQIVHLCLHWNKVASYSC